MAMARPREIPVSAATNKKVHIRFPLSERAAFDEIARAYDILNEDGSVRAPELCRLLMVVGITPSAAARTTAAVAAKINIKMIVARVGVHLSQVFGATTVEHARGVGPNRHVVFALDASLQEQVMRFIPNVAEAYDGHGKIVAKRVVEKMIYDGMRDPRLPAVLRAYSSCVNAFLARLRTVEQEIRRTLADLVPAMEGAAA
jgi:hypothetical protein